LVKYSQCREPEPIPLVKYGQGREPEPVSLADKLRAAGYQEPVLLASQPPAISTGMVDLSQKEFDELTKRNDLPLVSQRGFKAGVYATCLGGVFLGALYFGCGPLICGCVASGCVGFVCGMMLTQEWE
jgi:hypothetical protein